MTGSPPGRPGPDDGASAYRARSSDPVRLGRVGAGAGTTVAAWRGLDAIEFAGIGSAAMRVGEATVGALVVLIRVFGGLPEGVMYAILLMNALTPHINRRTQPRPFGG